MTIELNLWFSTTTGNIYGNIQNKKTREKHNIGKLVPIQIFTQQAIKQKHATEAEMESFLNDPQCDHKAMYAWTKEGSMACWNTTKHNASVMFHDVVYELPKNMNKMKRYQGMPDMYFRQID